MSPLSKARTPSTSLSEVNPDSIVELKEHGIALPWLRCCACERNCAISPFDDLLGYGINCLTAPEDLKRNSGYAFARVAES